jgi:hypothetical protein
LISFEIGDCHLFPLFALMQKVEQKNQDKSKCSAAFVEANAQKIIII